MKILKFIISWQFWVSVIIVIAISFLLLQGTFLWLNAYTNHGVQVEVPNLSNLNLEQAIVKLDESNLEYEIDTSKYDPKYKPYQILDIYPLVGSNVKKGRRIFIRANAKTWKPVVVPNIIGKYKYLAFSQLDLVGLKVSDTIYEPNLAVNTVIKILYKGKEVQPGVTLPRFSPLTIVLAKGLAKNVSVPSFIGLDESTAKGMITENLFSVGSIIYDDPEDKGNARVYYQVPVPSSTYDQGQAIDLYLSSKPLEKLKDKIRNLDQTFNRRFINDSDSLNLSRPVNEFENSPSTRNNTTNTHNSETNTSPPPPKTNTSREEHRRPNRVIIE
ncbi:PASTA domain-containing protein [Apibacter adventoris]|uniref:PASTA domain-containing protein n=1 Tax=Apibacter adventoris TaxID=1679466 RepID=UPI000CF616EA|nr:PASTA domain-containing protein [Apibacter adventoris]PQL94008.1 serine/threonine kinase [Apibacter adventoris]